jgi:RNA polymerase sigma-70 factor (ECF subfamily)
VSDDDLVRRLRAGDELAFSELVNAYHSSLVRLAQSFVSSRAVAEEVAQDTWVAVLKGLGDFEGRSSLKTWIFHILANRARSTGAREQRTIPVDLGYEGSVDRRRFDEAGAWSAPPAHWSDEVIERLSSGEFLARVQGALLQLPESQRAVVTLRDLDGLSSKEVCDVLEISEANQRVLLHRGRSRIRAIFEDEVAKR